MREKLLASNLAPVLPHVFDAEAYYRAGVFRKKQLKDGHWYFGLCRNATGDLAMWSQELQKFFYLRRKFTPDPYCESINHMADDDGFDLFIPMFEAVPNE